MNFYKLTFESIPIKFSSVIVATDIVTALLFVKEEQDPKLFYTLFGEEVLNNAVFYV